MWNKKKTNGIKNLKWRYGKGALDYVMNNNKNGIFIAKDEPYLDKKTSHFSSVKSYTELENLLTTDSNLYEVLFTSKRKIYIDIDAFKKNSITLDNLMKVIENFIVLINEKLKDNDVEIKLDDVIVLLNDDYKIDNVKSIHIIVNNYCMDYEKQLQLFKSMNEKINSVIDECSGDEIEFCYDESVYTSNKQFRMLNQSKLFSDDPYTFISLNPLSNITDTFITNTKNCRLLCYNKPADDDLQIETEKQLHNLTKKNFLNFIDYIEHTKLLNSYYRWYNITKIILKFNLMDIELWNDMSIKYATKHYNRDENTKLIQQIDVKKIKDNLSLLINILNKCSDTYSFSFEYEPYEIQKNKLKNYIENHPELEININEMNELKPKPVLANDIYEIELKKGLITDKRTNHIYYFFANTDCNNDIYEKIYIDDISSVDIKEFLNSNDKCLNVKSFCGTGKSHHILEPIINTVYKEKSILIITTNNSINAKNLADLKSIGFISHLETQKDNSIKLHTCDHVVCSIQSLWKLDTRNYDFIFLDEFESIISDFVGNNFEVKPPNECYKSFYTKCEQAEKIIILDADLKDETLQLFTNRINYETKTKLGVWGQSPRNMKVIHNNQNPYKDYKYIISLDDKDTLLKEIDDKLNENKKIVLASNSATCCDIVFNKVINNNSNKKICYIQRDGVFVWNGTKTIHHKEKDKQEYIEKLEQNLIKDEIDIWIYSPTISVGISINKNIFDYGFGYAVNCTTTMLKFQQQLFRARNLNDKEFKMFFDRLCLRGDRTYTHNQVKYHIKKKTDFYKQFQKNLNNNKYVNDKPYMEVFTYGKTAEVNRSYAFLHLLINNLVDHNLNVIIERKTKKTYTELGSYKENKEDVEYEKKIKFNEIRELNYAEYCDMKIKIDNKDNSITDKHKKEYYKTSSIYNIGNIKSLSLNIDNVADVTQLDNLIKSHIDIPNDDIKYNLCKINYKDFCDCKKTYYKKKEYEDENNEYEEEQTITNLNKPQYEKDMMLFISLATLLDYNYNTIQKTNNDLWNLIERNKELFKNLYERDIKVDDDRIKFYDWLENYKNQVNKTPKDKMYIKKMYELIKDVFKLHDIQVKYSSTTRNTTKINDKILIQPYNKIIQYSKQLYTKNEIFECRKVWYKNNDNNDNIYFILLQPRKNKIDEYYEKEKNIMYILEHYISDNNIIFELKNDFNKDIVNNKLKSKTFGKSQKIIYIINNIPVQIEVYKTLDTSIYKMNNDNTYTKKETITRYRPYKVDIKKKKLRTSGASIQLQDLTIYKAELLDINIHDEYKHEKFKLPFCNEIETIRNVPKLVVKHDNIHLDFINNYDGNYDLKENKNSLIFPNIKYRILCDSNDSSITDMERKEYWKNIENKNIKKKVFVGFKLLQSRKKLLNTRHTSNYLLEQLEPLQKETNKELEYREEKADKYFKEYMMRIFKTDEYKKIF